MIKALPVDTQNYQRRLDNLTQFMERYGVNALDVVVWPARDFESFGGNEENFIYAMENIGKRITPDIESVTMRLPYQITSHPGSMKWSGSRRGFRNCEQEIKNVFRGLASINDYSGKKDLFLSYHDQCEMQLGSSMSELVQERKRLLEMTRENADTLIDLGKKVFKKDLLTILMENNSYNKEAKPFEEFRDETAYISAEDFKEIIRKGIKVKLDPGHVILQLEAIAESKKGKRPLERRLKLIMAENGGKLPPSLQVEDSENRRYDVSGFIRVLDPKNILSVDVSQIGGYEQHGRPLGVKGGLVDYSGIKIQLRPDVIWTPEVGGSHKDSENGFNKDLLEALGMIEKF